jgi:hypothetical protein
MGMRMIGHHGENFFQGPFIWSGKIHPLDERFMAKSDPSNTFGNFSEKIKLDPSRQNLKPVDPKLTFDQYLSQALQEGYALLAEDAKKAPKDSVTKPDSVKLESKLGEISKNAYVRARTAVFNKLKPETQIIIEKMERNEIEKDTRWDTFCKAVTKLGDDFSK